MSRLAVAVILVMAALVLAPPAPRAALAGPPEPMALGVSVYWAEHAGNKLGSATVDGTNQRTLASAASQPEGLALDVGAGQLYWTDNGTSSIMRVDTGGIYTPETVVPAAASATGIAIDTNAHTIFWGQGGLIKKAKDDGTSITTFASGQACPFGVAVDRTSGLVYWTDPCSGTIKRSDGINPVATLVSGLSGPGGIALDSYGGKLYWVDTTAQTISRANLNGTSVQTIIPSGVVTPEAIAVDPLGGWIYWTEFISPGIGKVRAAHLDGALVQDVAPTGGTPVGIAVDPLQPRPVLYDVAVDSAGSKVYYSDFGTKKLLGVRQNRVVRTALDGTAPQVLVQQPEPMPGGFVCPGPAGKPEPQPMNVALDVAGGKLYWSGATCAMASCPALSRANLDGSASEVLEPCPLAGNIRGVALDAPNHQLYHADMAADLIARFHTLALADTTLLGPRPMPGNIKLDFAGARMYWTEQDGTNQRVMRATLAGAGVATLVTWPIPGPTGSPSPNPPMMPLALDVPGDGLYVSDNTVVGHERIVRYHLDGTSPVMLVDQPRPQPMIHAIALDVLHGKMYWTDLQGVWRSALSGASPVLLIAAVPPAVGGVAEQPDVAAPPLATSSGHGGTGYGLGVMLASVAGIVVAGWYARRRTR
jgi:DNA-binding beta-propeller fold protein YncE